MDPECLSSTPGLNAHVGSIVSVPVNRAMHCCRASVGRQWVGRTSFTAECWRFYCRLVSPAAALGHALGQLPLSLKRLPLQIVKSFMDDECWVAAYDALLPRSVFLETCLPLCAAHPELRGLCQAWSCPSSFLLRSAAVCHCSQQQDAEVAWGGCLSASRDIETI